MSIAGIKFLYAENQQDAAPIVRFVSTGIEALFHCPRLAGIDRDLATVLYQWVTREQAPLLLWFSQHFGNETWDRVWSTPEGMLVFRVFKQEDFEFINKHGGIRCIAKTHMVSRPLKTVSNVFVVEVKGW